MVDEPTSGLLQKAQDLHLLLKSPGSEGTRPRTMMLSSLWGLPTASMKQSGYF